MKNLSRPILLILVALYVDLYAAEWSANVYRASVVKVTDGDTIRARVSIWPQQTVDTAIRVRDLDTPELKGKCENERGMARMAKARAELLMPVGSIVTLSNVDADKFGGRHDADVKLSDGRKLADVLVADGLARRYDGKGKRKGWC